MDESTVMHKTDPQNEEKGSQRMLSWGCFTWVTFSNAYINFIKRKYIATREQQNSYFLLGTPMGLLLWYGLSDVSPQYQDTNSTSCILWFTCLPWHLIVILVLEKRECMKESSAIVRLGCIWKYSSLLRNCISLTSFGIPSAIRRCHSLQISL